MHLLAPLPWRRPRDSIPRQGTHPTCARRNSPSSRPAPLTANAHLPPRSLGALNTTDFAGGDATKMLFVNFAYTCKPCHDLMPHWSEAGLAMLNQTPPVIFSQVDVKSDGG